MSEPFAGTRNDNALTTRLTQLPLRYASAEPLMLQAPGVVCGFVCEGEQYTGHQHVQEARVHNFSESAFLLRR